MKQKDFNTRLEEAAGKIFGCTLSEMTKQQLYKTMCVTVRDILAEKHRDFYKKSDKKKVYYMSMEFLVGRSLKNNLFNLGLKEEAERIISEAGGDINEIYALEPDAGLGNGGLGRLASCYMDSMTTLDIPATGFSIRYEFGIFRQKIIDAWQVEFPDNWLAKGGVWLNSRPDDVVEVKLGGRVQEHWEDNKFRGELTDYDSVMAVPHDLFISGYDSDAVNKIVLWSAVSPDSIDMNLFSRGDYLKALEKSTKAEVISKVLYPADDHTDGKILRIKQQYFFVSASMQTIVNDHVNKYGSVETLHEKAAIHINDTHPSMCVPELMRILMDDYGLGWEKSWDITCKTLSYTNHTVMSEALERWSENMFAGILPRIYQIIVEINRRLTQELHSIYPGDIAKIEYMSVISRGEIKMANLCLAACHKINGVSKLHSEILVSSIFKDYYNIDKGKFTNVTNGIAYRRWLCQANPELTEYLSDLIGDGFKQNAEKLSDLLKYSGDKTVLENLRKIKQNNKKRLADYIQKSNGVIVDESSIFDVQIKRLHEYKRQLLNALHILYLYKEIRRGATDIVPRTFVFAAKASPGYFMAKQVIRLVVSISRLINNDPRARDIIKVVFLEDYKVTLAELIIPAAEISEQISIAGKEASGTGNMKLMINGAVTLGTLDGANVEISQQVGEDNIFLFGLKAEETEIYRQNGYNPSQFLSKNPILCEVVSMLTSGELGTRFDDIARSLIAGGYGRADEYLTLADFSSYAEAQKMVGET
ncbi:MAG: glycogen/starch/alpha-glucan phosphorylase, partial [Monoglobales bacterium]